MNQSLLRTPQGARSGWLARILIFTLIFSITLPLPAMTGKASPSTFSDDAPQSARPQTVTEVLFNGVAGFMGMPGLQSNQYDPYNPNADQGLGFHQDGTARRADGTTGNSAASAAFDGRRAASYMGNGMGYGPNARGMGSGYDPFTGGYDTTSAAYHARQRGGEYSLPGVFSDPQSYFMQRGLNYGVGQLNSLGEAAFTGLFDKGRARFNFMVDMDGRVNGEGDVLYPFYDGQYTTVFTQVGARSMSGMSGGDTNDGRGGDRWIGNFGLGQRWYPAATGDYDESAYAARTAAAPQGSPHLEQAGNCALRRSDAGDSESPAGSWGERRPYDAGNWMIGYNAFFDNDFTRSHQRGGFGVEAQYDWLKLASNYYFPLSSWKGSYDFDSRFVEERPAEGWDVRVKGYLPFYR
ncbi:MAG: inverse autotransporter beta domain-containing protein, partial [Deltaproteobacteria bacterium]|nr:inverse autotransporter beta domain-containing protein [Deltaproteobacteria bacterium]